MLCRRHIDQNVLAKLTEMVKDEEKYGAKSNPILKNLCDKTSHLGLKKIMDELKKARQMEISTGPISNFREVRRLIKGVIHPVLPDDPSQPLSNPPETAVTKGRRKTNSTRRAKSHWEYVSIAHRKIGKSSSSSSGSNSSPHGRGRPPHSGRSRGRGRSSGRSSLSTVNVVGDGNCGFRVVSNFLFGDENHWVGIHRRMIFDLRHHMRLQLVDGCPLLPLPVEWEYHRDMQVNGWATPYRNRMANWVARYNEMYPAHRHFMCLELECLHESVPQDIHPIVRRSACLLRLDGVGGNTLSKTELPQNPVSY
ncbi:hypothetical protein M9H77_29812 [Catharanthus roseus]|uniref:Uncharacterized protein n=1 Tax=Catharanthus roseus TaxID=4058 RepID=A0ACB9ZXC8_CATRO|nr:hypothetical protein M9H77_29812 [Catharanthus roseus]